MRSRVDTGSKKMAAAQTDWHRDGRGGLGATAVLRKLSKLRGNISTDREINTHFKNGPTDGNFRAFWVWMCYHDGYYRINKC